MNIKYIKLDKLGKMRYLYRNLFNIIREEDNTIYIPSTKDKVINKLYGILKQNNVDYIVRPTDLDIKYNELEGKFMIKYMIPDILEYCFNLLDIEGKLEEIYICVDEFSRENIEIIQELVNKVKLVNIVTNHLRQFQELEKRLEKNDIYITVSSNKRKALRRANFIINIDFKNFFGFNINRYGIIINCIQNVDIGKEFEGICIQSLKVNTGKVMRIFSDMPNVDKSQLIEAEFLKQNDYFSKKAFLVLNKIKVINIMGKRSTIEKEEFINIKKKLNIEVSHIA